VGSAHYVFTAKIISSAPTPPSNEFADARSSGSPTV
jgi:hypothetical protein